MRMITPLKLMLVAVNLIALGLYAANTQAGTVTWRLKYPAPVPPDPDLTQPVGNYRWTDTTVWEGGVLPAPGDTVVWKREYWANPIGIDTNGATINLGATGQLKGNYNGSVEVFYDSAFLTANANPLGSATDFTPIAPSTTLEEAAAASPTLTVGTINFSKQHNATFYMPVTVDTFTNAGSNFNFYGPLTVNTAMNLNGRGDTNDMVHTYGSLNATAVTIKTDSELHAHGTTTIGTLTIDHPEAVFAAYTPATVSSLVWNSGTYSVAADGAFPAGDPLTVPGGGTFNIAVPQSLANIPKIIVPGFSLLAGDMTNMVYDSTDPNYNLELQENAIFIPVTGETNLPTQTELGGATLYTGIKTSNDNVTVGDDGTSVYKGAANGGWYGSYRANNTQIHAATDSGNLQVVYFGTGCPQVGNNVRWYGDGTSTTADVSVRAGARLDMQYTVNQDDDYTADPTLIKTFNITGEDGFETRDILYFREGHPHIRAEQTYNVSKGKITGTTNLTGYMPGTLNVSDGIFTQPGDDFATTDGTLSFSGTAFVELMNKDNLDTFENLGTGLVYPTVDDPDGRVTVVLNGDNPNNVYNFDYSTTGTTPVLAGLLQNSDITRSSYKNTTISSDLHLGNGKFLYNLYDRPNGNGIIGDTGTEQIVYAGNGPGDGTDWIGFAAMRANQNVNLAVDAGSAIVQVGTSDPTRLSHRDDGSIESELPTHKVIFQQDVTAAGVNVQSGTGQFNQDLGIQTLNIGTDGTLTMASGKTAVVNELLSGTGTWGGGNGISLAPAATVAPGTDGAGTLAGGLLTLESNSTYAWDVTDPDGSPGTDWDLLVASDVDLGPDPSALNLQLTDVDLVRDIVATDEFIIAGTPGDFTIPANWTYAITAMPEIATWDLSSATLAFNTDVDVDGTLMDVLVLTGVVATLAVVPEPTSIALAVIALLGLLGCARRRCRKA